MFKPINGWTKKKILKVIEERKHKTVAIVDGVCSYLAKNGNKCAIGLFIPDGHNGQSFRGQVDQLLNQNKDLIKKMPLQLDGLLDLQLAHDDCAPMVGKRSGNAKQAMINWVKKNVK